MGFWKQLAIGVTVAVANVAGYYEGRDGWPGLAGGMAVFVCTVAAMALASPTRPARHEEPTR